MANARFSRAVRSLLVCGALAGLTVGAAGAQEAKQGFDTLSGLAFTSDKLAVSQPVEPMSEVNSLVSSTFHNQLTVFNFGNTLEWQTTIDKRTGLVSVAEGGGIGWVPGRGNKLTLADLAPQLQATGRTKLDIAVLENIARTFLPRVKGLLGLDPKATLVLNGGRSGQPASHLWFVDFDVAVGGQTVEGARVVFRVNNGNLVQFGAENLPSPGALLPAGGVTREKALAVVAKHLGGFTAGDAFRDNGSQHLLPVNVDNVKYADGFEFGKGRGLARVWQFVFHRDGVMGTWRARVDATSGELLELADINDYITAPVTGGVFPNSPAVGPEVVRAMPYANAGGGFANSAGLYNNTAATSSTLAGKYVKISDTCGAISQASNGTGAILFGASAGTDCTTPGNGGAGNTHASRTQYYHVNRIKEVARGWLPSNTWLNQQLLVNVNLNQTCNAYWNGTSLNFFKSGGGCGNTGEIAAVALHEFGHGMDQNDATGTAPEGGTGESYGDLTATIALHDSCIGPGFRTTNCTGNGDACTACTGVRDIDFAKHVSNTPATVANFTQVRCATGSGPCRKEVHCESYVPSEAVWDFVNRDLPNPGTGPAWTILDRLWYVSRNTATSSFTCKRGTTYTSNGCGAGNWWKVMRAVDDDDGNLTNGTPHGGALYAAFNRHGIACTTDAGASLSFAGCAAPAVPTVTATTATNTVNLSWTASGTAVYGVFRNEQGCNAGFAKISSGSSATSLTDTNVASGTTYYYQVTAFPSANEACASAPSTCITVTP